MNEVTDQLNLITNKLSKIVQEENIGDLSYLTRIWAHLPSGDVEQEEMYLERLNECVLDVSNLVDQRFRDLSQPARTAKKNRLMGHLLSMKAEQLDTLPSSNV